MSTNDLVERDAVEFGLHLRQGSWRLGLLVARNVEKGKGNGRPPKEISAATEVSKVSAEAFAKKSDTSGDRVLRYLKAWDTAALDGWVPESALLAPGEEPDGLDIASLPDWSIRPQCRSPSPPLRDLGEGQQLPKSGEFPRFANRPVQLRNIRSCL